MWSWERYLKVSAYMVSISFLLTACDTMKPSPAPAAPSSSPSPTLIPAQPQATQTPFPTTAAPSPTPQQDTPAPSPLSYTYVALGDSTPAGFAVDVSYVDYYAEYVESDLGVPVIIHNWAVDGQTAHSLMYMVRSNPKLRTDISQAKIITLWTGWNDIRGLAGTYRNEKCGGSDNLECIHEQVNQLNTDVELIIDEILTLCSPDETLILLANVGNPVVADWKAAGIFESLKEPLVETWIYHIEQIAIEKDIVLVDTYAVFNGPDGNDPFPDELSNGVHFNQEGHQLVADLHRAVGYGPLEP